MVRGIENDQEKRGRIELGNDAGERDLQTDGHCLVRFFGDLYQGYDEDNLLIESRETENVPHLVDDSLPACLLAT